MNIRFRFEACKVGGRHLIRNKNGIKTELPLVGYRLESAKKAFTGRNAGEKLLVTASPSLPKSLNLGDIFVYETWSAPEKLTGSVNVPGWQDVNPALSFDNRTMLMASRRPGGIGPGSFDIYVTTRRPMAGDR